MRDNDVAILGLKYSDTQIAQTTSLLLNSHYPISPNWRINPKLRIDYRENSTDDSTELALVPLFQMDYRWKNRSSFELVVGGEWAKIDTPSGEKEDINYFFYGGYRLDF